MVHVALTQGLVEKGHSIFPKQERIDLYQPVARRASILFGELVAIKLH